jgi:WD40 repeat protein
MAPEQAAGGRQPVGPPADVYALGAILYELLTGRPPFTAETPLDVLLQVRHDEPVPVTRLRPTVPRDLATIVHKCLAKEAGRRYAGAGTLADDLRRFLDGKPIVARPVGVPERLGKWARRHPVIALLIAVAVLGTGFGLGLAAWQWHQAVANAAAEAGARAEAQEHAAAESAARRETERLLVGADIDRATTLCERGDRTWGMLLLAHSLKTAVRVGDADLERVIRANLDGWRHVLIVPHAPLPHGDWVWDVAFSPDGRTVLTGSKDRTARLWDAVTGQPVGEPLHHEFPVWAVAFSPDGRTVLTGSGTGTPEGDDRGEARLWDAGTGRPLGEPLATDGTVGNASFSADGSRILTLSHGKARLWQWHLDQGKSAVCHLERELPHPGPVWMTSFSPDGRTVLTGGPDGSARVWDAATGKPLKQMLGHPGPVVAAAFRPDGRTVAIGSLVPDAAKKYYTGSTVRIWDIATCKPLGRILELAGPIKVMTFSPDGRLLLTGCVVLAHEGGDISYRGEARLWDADATEPLGPPLPHDKAVWAVGFSPDGRTFLTGSEDHFARLWLTATHAPIDFPRNYHNGTVRSLAYSPDGRLIVTGSAGDRAAARVWTVPSAQAVASVIPELVAAVSPDGTALLGQAGGTARLWDVPARKPGAALPGGDPVRAAAFTPDGKTLITVRGQRVEFRNAVTGQPCAQPWEGVDARLVVPDAAGQGLWLVTREDNADVIRHRRLAADKADDVALRTSPDLVGLAPSDDGRRLLAWGGDGARLWEVATGKLLARYVEQEEKLTTAAFRPGGKSFVTAGRSETAQLWETATGKPLGPPLPHPGGVVAVAFGRDGCTLLTGGKDGTARLWDVATGKPLGPPLPHRGAVVQVGFLPDGKEVFTSSEAAPDRKEGVSAFWDVPGAWPGEPDRVLLEVQVLTGMELDEWGAVRKLSAEEWQRRRQRLQAPDIRPARSAPE